MNIPTVEENRTCRRCGEDFIATVHKWQGLKEVEGWALMMKEIHLEHGPTICPACGEARDAEYAKAEEAARQAENATTRRRWRQESGIPRHFMQKGFEDFDQSRQKNAYDICLKWADEFPMDDPHGYPSLLLSSEQSVGVGKSHLAYAVGHRILDRWNGEKIGRPVIATTEGGIYQRLYAAYGDDHGESETDIINPLRSRRFLILDDLAKEPRKDKTFQERILYAIINGRYDNELPMVVTTNKSAEGLRQYLDGYPTDCPRFDRLMGMCGHAVVKMDGPSYR